MLRTILLTAAFLMFDAIRAVYGAGCTPGQIEKMIDKGFSKTAIEDVCGGTSKQSGSAPAVMNPTKSAQPKFHLVCTSITTIEPKYCATDGQCTMEPDTFKYFLDLDNGTVNGRVADMNFDDKSIAWSGSEITNTSGGGRNSKARVTFNRTTRKITSIETVTWVKARRFKSNDDDLVGDVILREQGTCDIQ